MLNSADHLKLEWIEVFKQPIGLLSQTCRLNQFRFRVVSCRVFSSELGSKRPYAATKNLYLLVTAKKRSDDQ